MPPLSRLSLSHASGVHRVLTMLAPRCADATVTVKVQSSLRSRIVASALFDSGFRPGRDSVAILVGAYPYGFFSVPENGVLTYLPGSGPLHSQLVWFDRSGKRLGTVGEPADYSNPAIFAGPKNDRRGQLSRSRVIVPCGSPGKSGRWTRTPCLRRALSISLPLLLRRRRLLPQIPRDLRSDEPDN
jgi:hypothetical protein